MYRNITYHIKNGQGIINLYTYAPGGKRVVYDFEYNSYLFLKNENGKYKSLFNEPLEKIEARNEYDLKKFSEYQTYDYVKPERKFLINYFLNSNHQTPEFEQYKPLIWYLDIEVYCDKGFPSPEEANWPVNLITIYDSYDKKYYSFCLYKGNNKDNIKFFGSEIKLLKYFIKFIRKRQPDIITGWNVENFDLKYLINRITKILGEKYANALSIENRISNNKIITIYGTSILDYMFLYKKFLGNAESYSLDNIANKELGISKIKFKGNLSDLYKKNFNKFLEYNIRDVELLVKLEEKLKFIDLTKKISYYTLSKFDDIYYTNRLVFNLLLIQGYKDNIYLPTTIPNVEISDYEGAFVFDPVPGIYDKGIAVFDFASLYPNIIITYNISPETKLKSKIKDCIHAFNNTYYRKDIEGIFPKILKKLYNERLRIKKEIKNNPELKYQDDAIKVLLNSFYGFVGYNKSPLFDIDLAEAVTITGKEYTKKIIEVVNKSKNLKVIYADTDSLFIDLSNYYGKCDLNKFCDKLNNKLNQIVEKISKSRNCNKNTIHYKLEYIANKGIFYTKKRYIIWIKDNEFKYTGVDIKRIEYSQKIKDLLKPIFENLLKENLDYSKLIKKMKKVKEEFFKCDINEIYFIRGINTNTNYKPIGFLKAAKSTPIHIKSAQYYNDLIEKLNLINKYEKIHKSEKVKFIYVLPNKFNIETIGFKEEFPKEFRKIFKMDYEKMFEKTIYKSLENTIEILKDKQDVLKDWV